MQGHIREVFTSIQGEGIYCGTRMTFVRFLGCNLSCNYCDTPETQAMDGVFVHQGTVTQNPTGIDTVIKYIDAKFVTLTGGEPLLQAEFVAHLSRILASLRKTIYLETNATLPDALGTVIDDIDIVALDFKIPTATGRPQHWEEHAACLDIASSKDVFVKIVVNENLLPSELETTCRIIQKVDPAIPLVIQPVFGSNPARLLEIQSKALESLNDVRIIPQTHKYLHLK